MPAPHVHCVLVVDDEQDVRETLGEVVEMVGCSALLAGSGADALRLLENERPCLIVLDLMMPGMNGLDLLTELRARPTLADLPVLISTSAPERAPTGVPVLAKPVSPNALWEWMRHYCECDRPPAND